MVKLEIDYCGVVNSCRKCLSICPVGALMKVPIGKMKSSSERPDYTIKPVYEKLCIGCKKCVDICPKKAIRIKEVKLLSIGN